MTDRGDAPLPHSQEQLIAILDLLAEQIQAAESIDLACDIIVEGGRRLGFERCRLWLLEPDQLSMRGQSSAGDTNFEHFRGVTVPIAATPYSRGILSARRLEVYRGEELGPWQLPRMLPESKFVPPVGQWIHAPLWAGPHCWGFLSLDNAGVEREISDAQRREVEIFCMFAAHALEQTLLLGANTQQQNERRWYQQLMAISAQAQEASSLEALARIIVQGGIELGFERARLWMLSEDQVTLIGTHQDGSHGLDNFVGMPMPCDKSPYVLRSFASKKPVRFHGLELGKSYLALQRQQYGYRPPQGDWVSIPLIARDGQPIGMLTLDTVRRKRPIDDQQLGWLETFARQISAALERARNSYQRDWVRTLTDLQDVPPAVDSPHRTAEHVVRTCLSLGFRRARLWEYDDQGNILLGAAQAGEGQIPDYQIQWMPLIASSYGQMEPQERSPIFKDGNQSERIRLEFFMEELGVFYPSGEWVCVPLWSRDTFLGILELDYGSQSHALYPGQRQLLHLLGKIVAAMYDHARLSEAEHHQRSVVAEQSEMMVVLRRLDEVAQRLQEASDTPAVYRALVEETLGFPRARLWVLEPDGKTLVCVAQKGCHRDLEGFRIPLEKSTYARHALLQREPLVFQDRASKPAFIDAYLDQLHFARPVGRWVCIPLAIGGVNIGMLALDGLQLDSALSDKRVLQLFAQHAEAALQRARQRSEWRELHEIAYTLHQVRHRQTEAELLTEIATAGRKVLQADLVLIFPYRSESQTLREPIYAGDVWQGAEYPLLLPDAETNIVRVLIRTREPYYSEYAARDPRLCYFSSARRSFTERQAVRSFAGIPLLAQGHVIGVLCVNYRTQRGFSSDDKLLTELFAQMAGLVITTSRLTRRYERGRIARDLHDTVKNDLRALTGRLHTANRQIRNLIPAESAEERIAVRSEQLLKIQSDLHEASRISRVAFDDINIALGDLIVRDEQSLGVQLRERLSSTTMTGSVRIHVDDSLPLLPLMLVRMLRNILAEAAVNAFERGQATQFCVVVRHVRGRLWVTARDDGIGFDRTRYSGPPEHNGLANIRMRVGEVGGALYIATRPERGVRLLINLPLRKGQANHVYLCRPSRALRSRIVMMSPK